MEIRHIKYFLDVCDLGSVHCAAQKGYISQQGLSRIIASMEQEIGVTLLRRSRNGVVPTLQGEIFYESGCRIVAEYDAMCEKQGMVVEHERDQVRVAYAYGVLSQLTLQLPNTFRVMHPEIDLWLSEYPFTTAERMVQVGKADLGFAYMPIDSKRFSFTSVFCAPWPLLVHRDNSLSQKHVVTCEDLAHENIILMSGSFKGHFTLLNRCRQLGIPLNVIAEVNDLTESYRWVQRNAGVAFSTFKACMQINDPNIHVLILKDDICTADIGIIKRKNEALAPAAQKFFDYVIQNSAVLSQEM